MFLDALLLVSDAQALTATAVATNVIDLGNPTVKNRIGSGEPVGFMITVDVASGGTTPTFTFEIVSDDNPSMSSPTVVASFAVPAAQLTVGAKFFFALPTNQPQERYITVRYTLGGTSPTLTVTACLLPRDMADASGAIYAKGYAA